MHLSLEPHLTDVLKEALPAGVVVVKDLPRVLDSTALGLGRQVQEEMKGVKHE